MRIFCQCPRQQFGRIGARGQDLVLAGIGPALVGNARPGEVNKVIGGLDGLRVNVPALYVPLVRFYGRPRRRGTTQVSDCVTLLLKEFGQATADGAGTPCDQYGLIHTVEEEVCWLTRQTGLRFDFSGLASVWARVSH